MICSNRDNGASCMRKSNHQKYISSSLFIFLFLLSIQASISKAATTAELSNGQTLELIGIGIYQELRNDIYVGALYGPPGFTDTEQLKDPNIAKRMSIRFVVPYSNRKLARHWKERMAMNNSRSEWQPLTREIVNFSKLFKRELVVGDELVIDHIPTVGTQIYLNSTLFETINKPGFTELLLNVWLGNIPPTKAFKTNIRGQMDNSAKMALVTQFDSVKPIIGRFDDDLVTDTKVASADTSTKDLPEEKAATKVAKNEQPKQDKKEPPKVAKNDTKQPLPEKTNKAQEPKNIPVATDKPVEKTAQNTDKPKIKTEVKLEPDIIPKKTQPEPQKVAKATPPPVEENFFDADLITGSYTRDLINSVRQYQEYPRKALIERREGDVTAQVTINEEGEIESLELVERSGSRVLDRAVSRIIKKAAPFQPIPPELKLKEFVFEVPISFQL